jgi:peptidoglycan-N-acetylglucosamine deacetylase
MLDVDPSVLFRFFNKKYLVCKLPSQEKILYLTFDDGPNPGVTGEILQILRDHSAKATFFCLGRNVQTHPDLVQSIQDDGHTIGNHTFSHLDGWKTPPGEYAENVSRCEEYFKTSLFRPPYGRFSLSQYYLLRNIYRFILWSVNSGDYHRKITPDACLNRVLTNSVPGSILLFHDTPVTREKVLFVLPRILEHFGSQGFRFEAVNVS